MVPWHDWISILAKREVSILLEPCLSQTHFVFQSNPRSLWRYFYWSWAAIQCIVSERIHRVHLPRRERQWNAFTNQKWNDPRRTKSQTRKTIRVLHNSEPDGRCKLYGGNSMRLDQAEDGSIQKYLETSSKCGIWVQFETRSREKMFLPKKGRMQSSSSTLPVVCIEKVVCMQTKDEPYQEVRLTPRVPRVVLKIEFANWSARSTWTWCKNISWPTKRIQEFLGDRGQPVDCRIPEKPLSAVEQQETTRTKNPSFKTSSRRRRSTSSARNRRSSSLTWTTQRSSSFAKHLQNSNALTAIYSRKSALSAVLVEDA